jgi:hypothetical protein
MFGWFKKKRDIDYLKTMQKLDIKDGDIVILKIPYSLEPKTHENMTFAFKGVFKRYHVDVNVLILENDMEIGILRNTNVNSEG